MKILNGNRVYVQNCDLAFFMKYSAPADFIVPTPILKEMEGDEGYFEPPPEEEFMNFDFYFEYPENVSWLMSQDWIVDFTVFDAMTDEDSLKGFIDVSILYVNNKSYWFLEQSDTFRTSSEGVDLQCELIEENHRIDDLRNLMLYQCGELAIIIPPELGQRVCS